MLISPLRHARLPLHTLKMLKPCRRNPVRPVFSQPFGMCALTVHAQHTINYIHCMLCAGYAGLSERIYTRAGRQLPRPVCSYQLQQFVTLSSVMAS